MRRKAKGGGGKRVLLSESWWLNSELEPCLKQRGCRGKREAGIFGEHRPPCFQDCHVVVGSLPIVSGL